MSPFSSAASGQPHDPTAGSGRAALRGLPAPVTAGAPLGRERDGQPFERQAAQHDGARRDAQRDTATPKTAGRPQGEPRPARDGAAGRRDGAGREAALGARAGRAQPVGPGPATFLVQLLGQEGRVVAGERGARILSDLAQRPDGLARGSLSYRRAGADPELFSAAPAVLRLAV